MRAQKIELGTFSLSQATQLDSLDLFTQLCSDLSDLAQSLISHTTQALNGQLVSARGGRREEIFFFEAELSFNRR